MKIKTLFMAASFAASLMIQPCLAQFDESPAPATPPATTDQPAPAAAGSSPVSEVKGSPFRMGDDGTFFDTRSKVTYLADPKVAPKFNSKAEAEAWVAKLSSGKHGLRDVSKPGDWRLPTTTEMASSVIRNNGRRQMEPLFSIGWSPEHRRKGYLGMADPQDQWNGDYNLNMWSDGGLDSGGFPAYIWPVRSPKVKVVGNAPKANGGGVKDLFVYDPGKVVFAVDQQVVDIAECVTFTKSIPCNQGRLKLELSLRVYKSNNYHVFELTTPGIEGLGGKGIGNSMSLFAYTDDWQFQSKPQTIYATGTGLAEAVKDLQAKLNGSNGRVAVSGSGDAMKGQAVITMLMNQ